MAKKLSVKIPPSPLAQTSADKAEDRVGTLRAMFEDTKKKLLSDHKDPEQQNKPLGAENEPMSAYEEDEEDTWDAETPITSLPRAPEYAEIAMINPYADSEAVNSTENTMTDAGKRRCSRVGSAAPLARNIEVGKVYRKETAEEIMLRLSRELETAQLRIQADEAHALEELKDLGASR
jgi:hypothetical protein